MGGLPGARQTFRKFHFDLPDDLLQPLAQPGNVLAAESLSPALLDLAEQRWPKLGCFAPLPGEEDLPAGANPAAAAPTVAQNAPRPVVRAARYWRIVRRIGLKH